MTDDVQIKTTDEGKAAREENVRALFAVGQAMARAYNHDAALAGAPEENMAHMFDGGWDDLTEFQRTTWMINADDHLYAMVRLFSQFAEWVNDGSPEPDPQEQMQAVLRRLAGAVANGETEGTVEGNYL